jgi:hypothetical protein
MLRLNMAVPVTPRNSPQFSSMGIINAAVLGLTNPTYASSSALQFIPNMDGFPNGRRLEDDVTRIELQAVAGVALAAIGLWYDDYSSGSPVTQDLIDVLTYTTGVESNDVSFKNSFPYLALPHAGDSECSGIVAEASNRSENFTGGFFGINQDVVSPKNPVVAMNYPNPFVGATTIRYAVESATDVNIMVFDRSGRVMETLVNQRVEAGEYEARFEGASLPAGIYFAKISTNGGKDVQVLKLSKQ